MSAGIYAQKDVDALKARVERLERMLQALIMATGKRPWLGDVVAWPARPDLDTPRLLTYDEAGCHE